MKQIFGIVISFIFLVWFFTSVLFMVRAAKSVYDGWQVPVLLGQLLLVFGIMGLTAALRASKKAWWVPVIVMAAGAGTMAFGLIYHFADEGGKERIMSFIPALAGILMTVTGALMLISVQLRRQRYEKSYQKAVEGTCIAYKTRTGSGGTQLRSPVYQAYFNGETRTFENDVYSNIAVPEIGEVRTLYTDGTDEFYEPISYNAQGRVILFIGLPFIVFGAVAVVLGIANM